MRRPPMMDSPLDARSPTAAPIGSYGLLGDTRTAALVSDDGAIDWLCVPRFDGEPLFGRLVGGPPAGTFRAGPAGPATVVERRYRRHTATLETTWAVDGGRLTLTEAMVAEVAGQLLPATLLVRRLSAEAGPVDAVVEFDPRLGARHRPPRVRHDRTAVVCAWGSLAVSLTCAPELTVEPGRTTPVTVVPGRPLTLVLSVAHREPLVHVDPAAAWDLLVSDEARWRAWTAEIDPSLPFREPVVRSLLTLRLLTYSPSGAPVAAPTTSLPEDPGGVRNWDYRYVWPRDASIGIAAFLGVGKLDEARGFLAWLLHASRLQRPRLPALFTLHGRHVPRERELPGWPGYAGSVPVRTGNGAADQHQLDGYGWVVDAAWVLVQAGHHLYAETWRAVRGFADLVARRWPEPDAGIWEIRGDAVHHVHSKLMGWLALDRALRIADTHRLGARQRRRWQHARDAIAAEVRTRGFDPARATYVRSYGSTELDAALLVLPLLGIDDLDVPPSARHDRRHPRRTVRRRPAAVPLPTGTRRPARHRRRVPALLVLARPSPRPHRTPTRSDRAVPDAAGARQPARPLRRGDGSRDRRPPRQLPADADPRRTRPGRPRHPGRPPPAPIRSAGRQCSPPRRT